MSVEYQERKSRRIWRDTYIEHPFSSLEGQHLEKQLYIDLINTYPLQRLKGIWQLGFLADKTPGDRHSTFLHNRFSHTVAVAGLMQQVLMRNEFSEREVDLGVASALLHDAAMPAFGDPVKLLDKEALDEETHWQEVANKRVRHLLKKSSIAMSDVDAVIKNQGVLGAVLDIVDRIAYVSKELHVVALESYRLRFNTLPLVDPSVSISDDDAVILDWYKKYIIGMGNLYYSLQVDRDTQQVYFSDRKQLGWFLFFRAALHEDIYLHPHNVGRDLTVCRMLCPFYQPSTDVFPTPNPSVLTPQMLRRMTDADLRDHVFRYASKEQLAMYFDLTFDKWSPQYEKFETIEEAQQRKIELERSSNFSFTGIKTIKGFKTGIDYLVETPSGIVSYAEAEPKMASLIQEREANTRGTYLYYTRK